MGRPKRHDREETLRRAVEYFWRNGFAGSSVRELGKALDLHPGSMYASFGSKESLYLEALEHYASQARLQYNACFTGKENFFTSLHCYLTLLAQPGSTPCTCMLTKTLSSAGGGKDEVVECAERLVANFRKVIVSTIAEAVERGELNDSVCAEELAELIQTLIIGLRSYSDSRPEKVSLERTVSNIVKMVESYTQNV